MVRVELRKYILSPIFLFAVILFYFSLVFSCVEIESSDLLYYYEYSITLGFAAFLLPVASVIPVAYFYYHEATTSYTWFVLSRGTKKRYVVSRILATALSGACVVLAATALFFVTEALLCGGKPTIGPGFLGDYGTVFQVLIDQQAYQAILGIMLSALTINGMLWPLICLAAYALTSNKYVIIAAPFIFRTLLSYLAQAIRCFPLDPAQLLLKGVMRNTAGGGIVYVLIYFLILGGLCSGLWIWRIRGRMKHG